MNQLQFNLANIAAQLLSGVISNPANGISSITSRHVEDATNTAIAIWKAAGDAAACCPPHMLEEPVQATTTPSS